MGFFGNILSSAIKVVATPVVAVVDVANAVAGGEEESQALGLLDSAAEDAKTAMEDLGEGDLL